MIVKFIEASNSFNWGKFMLLRHGAEECSYRSRVAGSGGSPIVLGRKFGPHETFVIDLQTGEGAAFMLGGGEREARYQLNECHRIWVCPLFEPFLIWLHEQPGLERGAGDLAELPELVELPPDSAALYGHRRQGGSLYDHLAEPAPQRGSGIGPPESLDRLERRRRRGGRRGPRDARGRR